MARPTVVLKLIRVSEAAPKVLRYLLRKGGTHTKSGLSTPFLETNHKDTEFTEQITRGNKQIKVQPSNC